MDYKKGGKMEENGRRKMKLNMNKVERTRDTVKYVGQWKNIHFEGKRAIFSRK